MDHTKEQTGFEIAIIGMSGRFPGAANLEQYWENLRKGVETIEFFSTHPSSTNRLAMSMLIIP